MSGVVIMNDVFDILNTLPKNKTIVDNFIIAWSKINSSKYKKIVCTISGGVIQM